MQQADPFLTALQRCIEIFMQRSMRDFLGFGRESGLSMSQLGALFHIHRMECSRVSDLGDTLGVTSSAASQLLERLVQQELILRSEDPNDRRVKQLILTDKGRQVLRESIRARQSWLSDLAKSLSEREKEAIAAALNTLIDKANHLSPSVESNHCPISGGA
jgi:DNA-binding MarR family transcriptional regulator